MKMNVSLDPEQDGWYQGITPSSLLSPRGICDPMWKGIFLSPVRSSPTGGEEHLGKSTKAEEMFTIALDQGAIIGPEKNKLLSFSAGVREWGRI